MSNKKTISLAAFCISAGLLLSNGIIQAQTLLDAPVIVNNMEDTSKLIIYASFNQSNKNPLLQLQCRQYPHKCLAQQSPHQFIYWH
ncbi:MAG: hypothetical protein IPL35_07715 [Sphingobacteriales bacterium]|nr:hypothetical protein [Sphingobacteriales bacterium]